MSNQAVNIAVAGGSGNDSRNDELEVQAIDAANVFFGCECQVQLDYNSDDNFRRPKVPWLPMYSQSSLYRRIYRAIAEKSKFRSYIICDWEGELR